MSEIEEYGAEELDFALLPLGDHLVTAVPLRRMPQETVAMLLTAPPGGGQYLMTCEVLKVALSPEDAERFATLDFGDSLNTVEAYLRTQARTGYPSVTFDLDLELKDLLDGE